MSEYNYKREWSRSDTLKLIELYEAATSLWDVRHEDYKNKVKKKKSYEAIAREFSTSILELRRKIHNLRSQWQAELKKVKASLDRDEDERYVSTWWCFGAMNFLAASQDNGDLSDPLEKRRSYTSSPPVKQEHEQEILLECPPDSQSDSPSDSEPELPKPKKKKKKKVEVATPSTTFVASGTDDDQIFGDYVASVMRGLSEEKKRKLRRKIQVAIVDVEGDDDVITPTSMKGSTSMCQW